jgi:hypothetical protein
MKLAPRRDHHVGAAAHGDARRLDLGRHAARADARHRLAGHRLDLGRELAHFRHQRGAGLARRGGIEAVDVGQQHQAVARHHRADAGGQPVVVAIADLARRHRVVLVDHRHRGMAQQREQGGPGVEIAPALLGVGERQQHLSGDQRVAAEALLPGMGERDLAHRGRRLALLQLERPNGQLEDAPAERDGARRDDENVGAARPEPAEVVAQRLQPFGLQRAGCGSTSRAEPILTVSRRAPSSRLFTGASSPPRPGRPGARPRGGREWPPAAATPPRPRPVRSPPR